MRVLAADDEPGVVRSLERLLKSWGYEATSANDGVEAWRILKHEDAPRVVILDWDMPGLTGIEVLRLLRATAHGKETYVVLLTARQHKSELIEALEAGADDFLSKPFEPRELQLRLAKGVMSRERTTGKRAAPPAATTVDGKYRLEKKIAEGGMATVWLGVHLSLGINVAIKFMKPDVAELADYASFEREARAAAQIRNPHAVRVFDHGLTSEGLPYLVMEWLSGESLWERVQRAGPLPLDEVVVVAEQVAGALADAHGRGIVHRDVKPENILLVDDEEQAAGWSAKLVDFGLAKPDWAKASRALSAGTPAYMSPEHLLGKEAANPGLDAWGLAATAYVAVTGEIPFDAPSLAEIIRRVCDDPPPVPSRARRVPPGFDAWFARACARDPAARFGGPKELAASLAALCEAESAR
ncbi:MAG TPA: response regulator [Labilithrix sp.]|jgi:serine/threonine-protein kinase